MFTRVEDSQENMPSQNEGVETKLPVDGVDALAAIVALDITLAQRTQNSLLGLKAMVDDAISKRSSF